MKEVNWQMKEKFVFPKEMGRPETAESIQITPRYTVEEFEGRPKLTGIYHIALSVNLAEAPEETVEIEEAILIDDLEIEGSQGYFEYALPFNIDFPPEAENPVDLVVENPTYEATDGYLAMIWDVLCTYEEAGIEKASKKVTTEKEEVVQRAEAVATDNHEEQVVAPNESTEQPKAPVETTVFTKEGDEVLAFIAQLEDGVSTTSFRLNDVFV